MKNLEKSENFKILFFENYFDLLNSDFLYFQNSKPGKIIFEKKHCFSNLINSLEEINEMSEKEYLSILKKKYLPKSFNLSIKIECENFFENLKKIKKKDEINYLLKKKNLHKGQFFKKRYRNINKFGN